MPEIAAHHGLFRDTNLHVSDTGGPGRPVVLIPGWPLTADSWEPQVQALQTAGYRVVTYDRRGFGRSDKPIVGYTYESLSDDLAVLLDELDLNDVTLVGFSMGGGEVASYCARKGVARLRSVVFASSVTPYMLHTKDNPEGPLTVKQAAQMAASLTANRDRFFEEFMPTVFTAHDTLVISEQELKTVLEQCRQASKVAALACMTAFGNTDFREDLPKVTVPALVIHGDADMTVPLDGSGKRTHEALPQSRLHVIADGPHGIPMSHAEEFNRVLVDFLSGQS